MLLAIKKATVFAVAFGLNIPLATYCTTPGFTKDHCTRGKARALDAWRRAAIFRRIGRINMIKVCGMRESLSNYSPVTAPAKSAALVKLSA
jgi:hypothetical protein